MPPENAAWAEERIEAWLPTQGLVYVFRWVPDFAPIGGSRKEHPTFDEWLTDMRSAAEGLEGASPECREVYDMPHYGVGGHRPMTDAERLEHFKQLRGEVAYRQKMLDALAAEGVTDGT